MEMQLEYKISARAKHLRIAVYPDGRVVVTRPARASLQLAQNFVGKKLTWIKKKIQNQQTRVRIPLAHSAVDTTHALQFVKSRVEYYNQHYKFPVGRVSVKNHKSLWGSCSAHKNLNFNLRIVQLPPHQADYIIVHELCHLREFNHSANFWKLVAETIPNYKQIRQELKSYSFK